MFLLNPYSFEESISPGTATAQYKFNDNAADTTVTNENGTDGSLFAFTSGLFTEEVSVSGKINESFQFNSVSGEFVNCNQTFQDTMRDEFSVAFWINPDDGRPSVDKYLLMVGDGAADDYFFINLFTGGQINCRYESNNAGLVACYTSSPVFSDGPTNWKHVVFTVSTTQIKIYIDSIDTAVIGGDTSTQTMGDWTSTENAVIGTFINDGSGKTSCWDGGIDDFRIYDKVLDQSEINYLYNNGSGTEDQTYSGLPTTTMHYKCNDNAVNTTVTDENGTNGTSKLAGGGYNTNNISVTGRINEAFDFNGTTSYVDTNQTFQSTFQSAFNVSFWGQPDDGRPVSIQRAFGVSNAGGTETVYGGIDTNGYVTMTYKVGGTEVTVTTTAAIFPNGITEWTHISINVNPTTMEIFINGQSDNSGSMAAVTMGSYAGSDNVFVGAYSSAGTNANSWDGKIDDFRIYNQILTQDEINIIYNGGYGTEI